VSILTDLRWAARQFRRRPAVPLIIVLSLTSAMGVSSSLFSIVNAAWFKPWPVPDAARLRVIDARITAGEWGSWPRESRSFSGLAANRTGGVVRLGRQRLFVQFVSANYFQVLRVPMAIGRPQLPQDARDVVVIAYELWQQRFAGDPNIVGRSISLERFDDRGAETITIVGVAGEKFSGTDLTRVQLWRPLSERGRAQPDASQTVTVFGRLAPGASDQEAQSELSLIRSRISAQERTPTAVKLLRTDRYSRTPPSIDTGFRSAGLIGGLVFITLIACANVSNLMLASGYARRGEVALRLSLGARRGGIIRQLLIESAIVSFGAGVFGIGIATWLPDAVLSDLVRLADGRFDFAVDGHVVVWSIVISLVACFGFGLIPALRSTDFALAEALKEGHDNSRRALMPSLLSYQTIVSVMAIVIAGLMLRSAPVAEARKIDSMLAPLSVVRLDLPGDLEPTARRSLVATISDGLHRVAQGGKVAGIVERQWVPKAAQSLHVTSEYFDVIGARLLAGRTFGTSDAADVVIVNEAFARRVWPDSLALGRIVSRSDRIQDGRIAGKQVIGIVANGQLSAPTAYLPATPAEVQVLLVHAPRDRVAREAFALQSRFPWTVGVEVLSGRDWVSPVIGPALLSGWITTGFGLIALLLGVVGFFSLLEYSVQQRTREIGIRRALGAGTIEIARSIIVPSAQPLARGLAMGSIGAAVLAEFMRRAGLPAGINPLDLFAYGGVAALLIVTAALAAYAPTRRALTIEPMKALRVD
jgi:predicted permease